MKLAIPAAALVLLALAGCAPSTDAAYKKCFDSLTVAVKLDDTLSADEKIGAFIDVGDFCSEGAKADPAAFNAEWAD